MKDAALIIAVIGAFIYGYFLMGKLDKFIEENRKNVEKASENKVPSCVTLADNLTDEEIMEEIRRFRANHEEMRIMLYDNTDMNIRNNENPKINI